MTNVQVGQVWTDLDKRRLGRMFEIIDITGNQAKCEAVSGGYRNTKIRLDRFKPKYYRLKGAVIKANQNVTKQDAPKPDTSVGLPVGKVTQIAGTPYNMRDACADVISGSWGGFGSYALYDNGKVSIIVRFVRDDCYDTKVRLDGHLIYSKVSRTTLEVALESVKDFLKSVRDCLDEAVG